MSIDTELEDLVRRAVRDAVAEVLADLSDRPLVCTKAETAELLRCSVSQVEKWLAAGLLRKMPHTSRVLIPRVAIEEFVDGQAAG